MVLSQVFARLLRWIQYKEEEETAPKKVAKEGEILDKIGEKRRKEMLELDGPGWGNNSIEK